MGQEGGSERQQWNCCCMNIGFIVSVELLLGLRVVRPIASQFEIVLRNIVVCLWLSVKRIGFKSLLEVHENPNLSFL